MSRRPTPARARLRASATTALCAVALSALAGCSSDDSGSQEGDVPGQSAAAPAGGDDAETSTRRQPVFTEEPASVYDAVLRDIAVVNFAAVGEDVERSAEGINGALGLSDSTPVRVADYSESADEVLLCVLHQDGIYFTVETDLASGQVISMLGDGDCSYDPGDAEVVINTEGKPTKGRNKVSDEILAFGF